MAYAPTMSGRPRDPLADDAIRRAAIDLTVERGYRGVSIEGIAARAKVAKQTVYRRYRTKGEVVLDAVLSDADRRLPIPDTGTLRGDLEVLLRSGLRFVRGTSSPLNKALLVEALQDAEFARQYRERYIQVRRDNAREVFVRAAERGEIDRCDYEFLVDLIYGPLWYRVIVGHADLADSLAARIAAAAARAVGAD